MVPPSFHCLDNPLEDQGTLVVVRGGHDRVMVHVCIEVRFLNAPHCFDLLRLVFLPHDLSLSNPISRPGSGANGKGQAQR